MGMYGALQAAVGLDGCFPSLLSGLALQGGS